MVTIMKKFFLVIVAVSFVCGSPAKYNFVPTGQFQEFDLEDDVMHGGDDVEDIDPSVINPEERTKEYWIEHGKRFVEEQVNRIPNIKKAKNIIMMIGDGLGHTTVAATRMAMGNENINLAFEKFPYTASSKTYCVDDQVADSACTATAYLAGVKGNTKTIGVTANLKYMDCVDTNNRNKYTESLGLWAQRAGKATGVVTNTRVTHASPAGVYAHTASRDWEDDYEVTRDGCDASTIEDIAMQLVHGEVGSNLNVVFGGGSRAFIPNTVREHNANGRRRDGRNLINEWQNGKANRTFIRDRDGLMNLNVDQVNGDVFGLFTTSHLSYNLEAIRLNRRNVEPTLTEMATKAIDLLSKNDNGYFLFIEGGRIDHGHHDSFTRKALDETIEFSKAVQAVADKVNLEETLIVVTADHSHVFTYAGYPHRGNDIYGFTASNAQDGMRFFTLSYTNGPGFTSHRINGQRVNPSNLDRSTDDFEFPAKVFLEEETHSGEDVGIWAVGPWAHMYQGTIEQSIIPHVMAFASCIGNGKKSCDILDYSRISN